MFVLVVTEILILPKNNFFLEKIRHDKPPRFQAGPDFPEFTLCEL